MLSDIEIAQQAKMLPITEVAAKLGIGEEDIEMYGRYKAKLSMDLIRRMEDKPGRQAGFGNGYYAYAGRRRQVDYYRRTGPGPGQN